MKKLLVPVAAGVIVASSACSPPGAAPSSEAAPPEPPTVSVPSPAPLDEPAHKIALCVSPGSADRLAAAAGLVDDVAARWVDVDSDDDRPALRVVARVMPQKGSFAASPFAEGAIRAQPPLEGESVKPPPSDPDDFASAQEMTEAVSDFHQDQEARASARAGAAADAEALRAAVADPALLAPLAEGGEAPDFAGCAAAARIWFDSSPALAKVLVVLDDDGVRTSPDVSGAEPFGSRGVHMVGLFDAPSAVVFDQISASYSWFAEVAAASDTRFFQAAERAAAVSHLLEVLEAPS